MKVFAGVKLKGINPSNAPARAVIKIIAIKGESFRAKIISKDRQDITPIPAESPSNPSIKFIAFVIPTIQIIVIVMESASLGMNPPNPPNLIYSNTSSYCTNCS